MRGRAGSGKRRPDGIAKNGRYTQIRYGRRKNPNPNLFVELSGMGISILDPKFDPTLGGFTNIVGRNIKPMSDEQEQPKVDEQEAPSGPVKRKAGRPKGSKNKPKNLFFIGPKMVEFVGPTSGGAGAPSFPDLLNNYSGVPMPKPIDNREYIAAIRSGFPPERVVQMMEVAMDLALATNSWRGMLAVTEFAAQYAMGKPKTKPDSTEDNTLATLLAAIDTSKPLLGMAGPSNEESAGPVVSASAVAGGDITINVSAEAGRLAESITPFWQISKFGTTIDGTATTADDSETAD